MLRLLLLTKYYKLMHDLNLLLMTSIVRVIINSFIDNKAEVYAYSIDL